MSRDWQKDMELIKIGEKSDIPYCVSEFKNMLPYWHQEAEKWRREAFRKYPTPEAYDAACAALHKHRERADQAEAREQKLRKAMERIAKESSDVWALHLTRTILASLYPKEGETT